MSSERSAASSVVAARPSATGSVVWSRALSACLSAVKRNASSFSLSLRSTSALSAVSARRRER